MSKARKPRKEVTSVRVEPQVRYLLDIAARAQRRSVTNFIESAILDAVKNVELVDGKSVWDLELELWDLCEKQRLLNLKKIAPRLLNYDDQIRLKELQDE